MSLLKYKEMNVMVMEDMNYRNFTPQRKSQYPVLIDRALLDSDVFNMVYQIYPDYFQRSEEHLCFDWDKFYRVFDSRDRLITFNNVMKVAYGNEVQYLLMKDRNKGIITDTFA